jgi:hypothetical protein
MEGARMIAAPFLTERLSPEYRDWNSLLIEELFPRGRAGVPVYLSLHVGLLDQLGAGLARGGRDGFVRAVLALGAPFFVVLARLGEMWSENGRGGPPPFVAGLGLAVLAAGDMASDDNGTQANYYVRLQRLLGGSGRDRPEGFERTPDLWQLLQQWLRSERRGELVVRGANGAHRFVDPVKSQCLIRSCDVEGLLPVARDVQVGAGQLFEPADVVPALRSWLLTRGARSRLAALLGRDPDTSALLHAAEALCDLIDEATPESSAGENALLPRPLQRARLSIRPNPYPNLKWKRAEWLLRLAARADADEPECLLMIGDRVVLARLDLREPATYDVPLSNEEGASILLRRLRVTDDEGNDVTPQVSVPLWFRDGELRGRPGTWDSVDVPEAGIAQTVAFLDASAIEPLRAAAEHPLQFLSSPEYWPGAGVYAAHDATPRPGATLPGGGAALTRAAVLRLVGGLPIRRHVYLRTALPAVVGPDSAPFRLENLEGRSAPIVGVCGAFKDLDVAEGPYRLHCNGATAELFVVEPRWRECIVPRESQIDRIVSAALQDATIRGPAVVAGGEVYATYFWPGTHFRVYAPRMMKGVAPTDGGVCEFKTSEEPRQIVIVRRTQAPPPLPLAECFSATDAQVVEPTGHQREGIERLLEFMSARGSGPIDAVRAQCAFVAGDTASWHSALSTLEDLGHVDVSWDNRRWTVASPTLAPCGDPNGRAILVGARARQTVSWLREHRIDAQIDERSFDPRRGVMPASIRVPLEGFARARTELKDVNISVLDTPPFFAMALHARPVTDTSWWIGPEFSPSARVHTTLECWDPVQLRWRSYGNGELGGPALYRWREHGVRVHYLVASSLRARVRDPAAAKWLLAPSDRSYVAYDASARCLLIPMAMGLPRLYRRICAIASGVMPLKHGRTISFDDIPVDLARAMAVRLNQCHAEGLL